MSIPPEPQPPAGLPETPAENDRPSEELARRTVRGALWTGVSQYALFALGIVKVGVLARLVPEDYFGALTIAVAWSSYLLFFRFDFRVPILSWEQSDELLNTHFWLDLVMTSSGVLLAALAYVLFGSLLSPSAWAAIFLLIGMAIFESLTLNPRLLTEREMRQDLMAQLTLVASVLTLIVPIGLALAGQFLLAVVFDATLPTLVLGIGLSLRSKWRPRWQFNRAIARRLLDFGYTMWTTGLLGKVVFQFDDWLVGTLNRPNAIPWLAAGQTAAAYYGRAYTAGKMPMDVFAGFLGSIALPLYARSEAEGRAVLRTTYRQISWLLAYMIFFSSAVALSATREIILVLLGENWLPTVPLFQLMSLFILGRPLYQNASQLLLAVGLERPMRRTVLVQALFLLVAGPPAVWFYGAAGGAVVISVMTLFGLGLSEYYVRGVFGRGMWQVYVLPASVATVCVVLATLLGPIMPENIFISGTLKGLLCVAGFGLAALLFERRQLVQAWGFLRANLRRKPTE